MANCWPRVEGEQGKLNWCWMRSGFCSVFLYVHHDELCQHRWFIGEKTGKQDVRRNWPLCSSSKPTSPPWKRSCTLMQTLCYYHMPAPLHFRFRGIDFLANNKSLETRHSHILCIKFPGVLLMRRLLEDKTTMVEMLCWEPGMSHFS